MRKREQITSYSERRKKKGQGKGLMSPTPFTPSLYFQHGLTRSKWGKNGGRSRSNSCQKVSRGGGERILALLLIHLNLFVMLTTAAALHCMYNGVGWVWASPTMRGTSGASRTNGMRKSGLNCSKTWSLNPALAKDANLRCCCCSTSSTIQNNRDVEEAFFIRLFTHGSVSILKRRH